MEGADVTHDGTLMEIPFSNSLGDHGLAEAVTFYLTSFENSILYKIWQFK